MGGDGLFFGDFLFWFLKRGRKKKSSVVSSRRPVKKKYHSGKKIIEVEN